MELIEFLEEIETKSGDKKEKIVTESPPSSESAERTLPEKVVWESPLFGKLFGGPVLEMTDTHLSLIHPLSGEKVVLSIEWLVSAEYPVSGG